MTYEQLRATIIARMQAFTGIKQSHIDYQNPGERYDPPPPSAYKGEADLWCRLAIETARPITQGLCQPMARIPGNIIIQCFDKAISQTPTLALVRLADELVRHFQYWEAPGLQCREAQLINVGAGASVGNPSGTGYTQANVQIYFLTF